MKKILTGRAYQMTITLRGIRPPIWRRVQVPGTISLAAFHDVIQRVFGWTDSHLHQFVVAGRTYGQPDDFDEAVEDESGVTLANALGTRNKRFLYVYDFGDNWEHDVVVENIVAGNSVSEVATGVHTVGSDASHALGFLEQVSEGHGIVPPFPVNANQPEKVVEGLVES
jgi:hypothetical protein